MRDYLRNLLSVGRRESSEVIALQSALASARSEVRDLHRQVEAQHLAVRAHRQEALDALADRDAALRALLDAGVAIPREQWARPVQDLVHTLTPAGRTRLRDLMDQARPVRRADALQPGDRVLAGGGAHPMTVDSTAAEGPGRVRIDGRLDGGATWTMHLNEGELVEFAEAEEAAR